MMTMTTPKRMNSIGATATAISIRDLSHRYPPPSTGRRRRKHRGGESPLSAPSSAATGAALDGVSLDVQPGEIFGILGPNGSGKTTLFRILATLLRPTAGELRVFDHDVINQPQLVRRRLGIVFQTPSLDLKLTADENLRHQGRLYGLSGPSLRRRIDELLDSFGLSDRRGELIERFSGGMRRCIELAKALLHAPALLLLDEPASGLDPAAQLELWQQLDTLHRDGGVTIALTTHLMAQADRCGRLAVLCQGRLVAIDTPAKLKARIGGDVITIEPDDVAQAQDLCHAVTERFGPWPDGSAPAVHDGAVRLQKPDGPAFVASLSAAIAGQARSITVGKPALDDVFLQLTGHGLDE